MFVCLLYSTLENEPFLISSDLQSLRTFAAAESARFVSEIARLSQETAAATAALDQARAAIETSDVRAQSAIAERALEVALLKDECERMRVRVNGTQRVR